MIFAPSIATITYPSSIQMPPRTNRPTSRNYPTPPNTRQNAASQSPPQTLRSPPPPLSPPTPAPTKTPKPKPLTGRTISLHNIPLTATHIDILSLLPNITVTEYKRTPGSSVVFLLLPTLDDAKRVFLNMACGKELMGQEVRAVFVNGVKFKNDSSVSAEEREVEEARIRALNEWKLGYGSGNMPGS
jgi:hypothetical protein